jgi:cytochrome bd-type quinol oxidase subunit 2
MLDYALLRLIWWVVGFAVMDGFDTGAATIYRFTARTDEERCAPFPFLMPSSTHPDHGLTIWDASSSQKTLLVMLIAVVVFRPIIMLYTGSAFRVMRGRITLEAICEHLRC